MSALLFALLVGHAVADYPLQGDFLARGKNHKLPIPGVPFYQCLLAHAVMHGGMVYALTGQLWLGLLETALHTVIDWAKCQGLFGIGARAFNIDQALHVVCKVAYAAWLNFALGL